MFRKSWQRLSYFLLSGSILFQSCAVSSDDVQNAAANSVEIFLSDVFAIALAQFITTAFNVPT